MTIDSLPAEMLMELDDMVYVSLGPYRAKSKSARVSTPPTL